VAGSFLPRRGVDLGGLTVILVDDVTTTRATLTAACKAAALCCKPLSDKDKGFLRIWTAVAGVTPQDGIGR
jgi:hypoxanthine phosphoribosyltransferase